MSRSLPERELCVGLHCLVAFAKIVPWFFFLNKNLSSKPLC
jgi:hypothetical protein